VFALGTVDITPELLVDTVTRVWVNALGIRRT
jgi:hypothetical protein